MPTGAIEISVTELEVVDPNEKIEPKLPEVNSDVSMQVRNFSTDTIKAELVQEASKYNKPLTTIKQSLNKSFMQS